MTNDEDIVAGKGQEEPRQVFVLGMHRSGTSALTGALSGMGLFVGDEPELTQPLKENPRGFFERKDARRLCDGLLHDSEADWWKISSFDPLTTDRSVLAKYQQDLFALIEELDSRGHWALKEPRLCLLFPFFRCLLRDPLVVVILRHPVEVARSLRERNGIPMYAGLALWEAYTLSALKNAQGEKHFIVQHAEMMRDPKMVLSGLAGWLSRYGVGQLDVPASVKWIDPSLHRQKLDGDTDDVWLSENQFELWKRISSWESVGELPSLSRMARNVLAEFEVDHSVRLADRELISELRREIEDLTERSSNNPRHAEELESHKNTAEKLGEQVNALKERLEREQQTASDQYNRKLLEATASARDQIWELESRFERMRTLQSVLGESLGEAQRLLALQAPQDWRPDLAKLNWADTAVVSVVVSGGGEGGRETVKAALKSLRKQSWALWELLVVRDSGDIEKWRDLVPADEPRLRLVSSLRMDRWSALNAGMRAARGDLVTYYSQESVWHYDYLAACILAFQENPSVWLAVVPDDQHSAANHNSPSPTVILPSLGAMMHRREAGECLEGFIGGSQPMVLGDWIARYGSAGVIDMDSRLCRQIGIPEHREISLESLRARQHDIEVRGPRMSSEWTPDLSKVAVITYFTAGRAATVRELISALSGPYDVELNLWCESDESERAKQLLQDCSVEGRILYALDSDASQIEMVGVIASTDCDFIVAFGQDADPYLHSMMSHFHIQVPVLVMTNAEDQTTKPSKHRKLEKLARQSIRELSAVSTVKRRVVLTDCKHFQRSGPLTLAKVAVFERCFSRLNWQEPAAERLVRGFSEWRRRKDGCSENPNRDAAS